jgi:zinc D-Ala-D-Ala dipeptidase
MTKWLSSLHSRRHLLQASALLPFAVGLASCAKEPATPPTASPKDPAAVPDVVPVRGGTAGLVELIALDPTIRLDLRYATINNFTGRVLYRQARAFMVEPAALAVVRAHKALASQGLGLSIFDAYRPWAVTKQLWDATEPAKRDYVANPKRGSRHNRGCAIDLTLCRLIDGVQLPMPSTFDDFSERAHRNYLGGTTEETKNRAILEAAMVAEGFIGMSNEWWHFDYKDWANFPVLDIAFEDL